MLRRSKRIMALAMAALLGAGVTEQSAKAFSGENRLDALLEAELREEKNTTYKNDKAAVVYLTDFYQAKEAASFDSKTVRRLPSGQTVFVDDTVMVDGVAWFKVHFYENDICMEAYIEEANLAYTDAELRRWTKAHVDKTEVLGAIDGMAADVMQFPESYRNRLAQLKVKHPNWIFVPMDTGINWSDAVFNEINPKNRSWAHNSTPDSWKGAPTGQKNWYYATQVGVEYCLDPRNFLNETDIFQFEQLTYHAACQNVEGVQNFLNNSFMAGYVQGGEPNTFETYTYAQMFCHLGTELNVSPYHLASRVYQEQGMQGTSPLISGRYPGMEHLFNYFNIGASGNTSADVIKNGLARAQREGWFTPASSILGGAKIISKSYILKGQDTLYLQKFDVDNGTYDGQNNGMFAHQYMQNISAPTSESRSTYKLYAQNGALNSPFVFKIPIYWNMPNSNYHMFSDVYDYWQCDAIAFVVQKGIMVGKQLNYFGANDNLTRAELATVMYSACGKPETEYREIYFDVPNGTWYSVPVSWVNKVGIAVGYGNGYFGTNDSITREQMIVMLYHLAIVQGYPINIDYTSLYRFPDDGQYSAWAREGLAWATTNGLIVGKNGNIAAKDKITRAEAAAIMKNYYSLKQ